jgi:tRNA U34 5-methylaminomethyl-2-thiouridine-forming methyltransferase MnmC
LKRKIIITSDGSTTIHLPEWDEQYHSKHGAIQEAIHVFIKSGLYYFLKNFKSEEVSILEIGFGTGLNAFLTLLAASEKQLKIKYVGVEAYPVENDEIIQLNYINEVVSSVKNKKELFKKIHAVEWEQQVNINSNFSLKKQQMFFNEINEFNKFDIIYFDAFGARVQPELWTEEIFVKMYKALKRNSVLVTYSAKGSVRRAMQTVGFEVEKIPGPPGKREMLRATKL